MPKLRNIEKVFLSVLQEDGNREIINKDIRRFNISDWAILYEVITKNGLFPIFYTRLLTLKLENIPQQFLSNLKDLYVANLKRNITLQRELFKILAALRESGITVMPLKGPILARYLYRDLALRRTSCDLDLLVKEEQFEPSRQALEKEGYGLTNKDSEASYRFNLKYYRQLKFNKKISDEQDLCLELHWDVRDLFSYTALESFWQDTRELELEGNKVLAPSDENLLIYLSLVSMTVTEFTELRYLYDIYTLIAKYKDALDWRLIAARLKHARSKDAVYFSLKLAQEFFHFDIPKAFMDEIRPNIIKTLILKIWINKGSVLHKKADAGSHSWYWFFSTWRYLATSYLYSRNVIECVRIICRKIFLPANEVRGAYIKRLLKPFSRF